MNIDPADVLVWIIVTIFGLLAVATLLLVIMLFRVVWGV